MPSIGRYTPKVKIVLMHVIKVIHYLQKISHCINKSDTGTPKELALKLKIGERQVLRYIDLMKQLGAPVDYCRKRKSYYFRVKGCFSAGFTSFEEESAGG